MKKNKSLILILLLALQVSPAILGQSPVVRVSTPANWVAGNWSAVEIEISDASGAGPCRFVQDYPVGFRVKAVNVDGGDLFFDNNRLNVVWSKLPVGGRTTFSYEVMPDRALSGMVELGGMLYVVTGTGNRKIVSVPPKSVLISAGVATANERQQATRAVKSVPEAATMKDNAKDKKDDPVVLQGDVVQYRVQVLSSSSRMSDSELKRRLGISFSEGVTIIAAANIYKYQVGDCADYDCAVLLLDRFKKAGVEGAFIVAFSGGEQITIEEARSLRR